MIRTVIGFHQETDGNWVAELSCWHKRHVEHRPPFQESVWVLDSKGRAEHVGSSIDCPLCERAELPAGLAVLDSAGPWDETSIPDALRHTHRTPQGRWGNLQVLGGTVNFQFRPEDTPPGPVLHLSAGSNQPIPPDLAHRVIPSGSVHLELEFWGQPPAQLPADPTPNPTNVVTRDADSQLRGSATPALELHPDEGGDSACWAGLLCVACGAVLDGGPHRRDCPAAGRT